jgi:hypothetical protein
MAEPLIIQRLKQKRAEISGLIAAYQAKIAHARHDLAYINAVIRLVVGGEQERAQYIVSRGFFEKGEVADICVRHLKADGELDTRQLAERVTCKRKLEVPDTPLRTRSSSRLFRLAACRTARSCDHGREAQGYPCLGGRRRAQLRGAHQIPTSLADWQGPRNAVSPRP